METVPQGPARIADVAAFAGVGIATVSRVLNGRANVSQATRDRVQEAIRVLDSLQHFEKHGEVCPAGWTKGAPTIKPGVKEAKVYFEKAARK